MIAYLIASDISDVAELEEMEEQVYSEWLDSKPEEERYGHTWVQCWVQAPGHCWVQAPGHASDADLMPDVLQWSLLPGGFLLS